ncbi:hypothetical protein LCGC14_0345180 [marine sediment metagenome]|uniref:Uncharacterized protein n=1 Tax=marine sediment metagenome TaxID=412755 RepID=A0A0F9TVB4_9ZZZZ
MKNIFQNGTMEVNLKLLENKTIASKVVKESLLSMLSKSEASPYKVTLILSFVLSSYSNNLQRIKLKPYRNNCGLVLNQRSLRVCNV